MSKFKIPGVSFSLNRALIITQAKQKFARETGIPRIGKKNWQDSSEGIVWKII